MLGSTLESTYAQLLQSLHVLDCFHCKQSDKVYHSLIKYICEGTRSRSEVICRLLTVMLASSDHSLFRKDFLRQKQNWSLVHNVMFLLDIFLKYTIDAWCNIYRKDTERDKRFVTIVRNRFDSLWNTYVIKYKDLRDMYFFISTQFKI